MQRTYEEILNDLQTSKYGKECRKLHKELKKLNRKNGLPLSMRYPYLPLVISIIALALVVLKPILIDMLQWLRALL